MPRSMYKVHRSVRLEVVHLTLVLRTTQLVSWFIFPTLSCPLMTLPGLCPPSLFAKCVTEVSGVSDWGIAGAGVRVQPPGATAN